MSRWVDGSRTGVPMAVECEAFAAIDERLGDDRAERVGKGSSSLLDAGVAAEPPRQAARSTWPLPFEVLTTATCPDS